MKNTMPICFAPRTETHVWLGQRKDVNDVSTLGRKIWQALQQNGALYIDEITYLVDMEDTEVVQGLKELVGLGVAGCDGFNSLHKLGEGDGKSLVEAGRWHLNHMPTATSGHGDRDLELVAKTLLRRYGVVFRKVLEREWMNVPSWRELLITYRKLEAQGQIRGGRFVAGFSGEQFALPEAVGSLRQVRRQNNTDDMVTISAADPLNLVGIVVPGERISTSAKERILLRGGVPIAAQSGKEVRFIQTLDDEEQWQARNALVQHSFPTSQEAH